MRESIDDLLNRVSRIESVTPMERRWIIGFIETRKTMADDNLFLIKHLTKAAGKHMVNVDDPLINKFLERLYHFNIQGAVKTRALDGLLPHNILKIKVHFLGYAADVSMKLYYHRGDRIWLKRWYSFRRYCAEQSVKNDPVHAVYSFGAAARAAFAQFEHLGKIPCTDYSEKAFWLQQAYDCSMRLVGLHRNSSSEKTAYAYLYCGHYMSKMFCITHDKEHAEEAIACYRQAIAAYFFTNSIQTDVMVRIKNLETFFSQ